MARERVGFIGLGIMGSRMAANLAAAGYELTVWNRTAATAEAFGAEHGVSVATTPAELAAVSDVVIKIVVDGEQVEEILFGEQGIVAGARAGTLCIDMSTISPEIARSLGERLSEHEIAFVDAPVTGSSPGAQAGTLTIMAGGSEADLQRADPIFDVLGAKTVHCGALGQGQTIKVITNAIAASNAAVLAQALIVARGAGVDLAALTEVIDGGAADSRIAQLKLQPMIERQYDTLFRLDHMIKDVDFALKLAEAEGTPFDYAAQTRELMAEASSEGFGEVDFASIYEALQARADLNR
jgi:3-hydroxyisobutyrate dehydrogenase-like beta-hydroxyacid dehydrogenase